MTDKSDDRVGHLNIILARGGGNLNDSIFKSSKGDVEVSSWSPHNSHPIVKRYREHHHLPDKPLLLLRTTRSQKNPWLPYDISEVKTSVVLKPTAFLEELPFSEKQWTNNVVSLKFTTLRFLTVWPKHEQTQFGEDNLSWILSWERHKQINIWCQK